MSKKALADISRTMSYKLRHDPTVQRDPTGYIPVTALGLQEVPFEWIQRIVSESDKQRFTLQERSDGWYIRANQGHSEAVATQLADEKMLKRIIDPMEGVFHGTYKKFVPSIKTEGLKRMSRKHIHMAKSRDAISGQRASCDVLIYIDMAAAMADGIIFYESDNGVVLTEGIDGTLPPKYFTVFVNL